MKAEREEGVAGAIAEAVAEATAAGERQSDPTRSLGAVLAIAVQVLPAGMAPLGMNRPAGAVGVPP